MDFLSAARGYGLAVGLLLWALEFVLRYLDEARPEQLWRASLALGLGAAANLTMVFPGIALVVRYRPGSGRSNMAGGNLRSRSERGKAGAWPSEPSI